ncbi:MAG: hypothetical protein DRO12_01015 [Thermoprotei archaeon]|nr:MAG: hypothetical protein DRO12_01015 [Thermoprotei archaeon]
MHRLFRLLRIIINSFGLVLLLVLAFVLWKSNPALSVLLALAAVDQLEDVYYYVYMKRFFPEWFMPFDMLLESALFCVGLGMLVFSLVYHAYFETWFFKALIPLSILVMWSSVEDVMMWRKPEIKLGMVTHYVCPKEKVRGEEKFVRRK